MRRRTPEGDLLKMCLQLLTLRKVAHDRMNVGAANYRGRFVRYGTVGMADLRLTVPGPGGVGRTVWVELKASRNYQTAAQRIFEARETAAGAVYRVVRSVEELILLLEELGA